MPGGAVSGVVMGGWAVTRLGGRVVECATPVRLALVYLSSAQIQFTARISYAKSSQQKATFLPAPHANRRVGGHPGWNGRNGWITTTPCRPSG